MSSTILNNLIRLMANQAVDVETEKISLMSVVPREDFDIINECVLDVSCVTGNQTAKRYRFARNQALEHGWTKQDYIDWAKRWRVT